MKTRQSAISALLIFAVLLLSACGGGGGSSDGNSSGGGGSGGGGGGSGGNPPGAPTGLTVTAGNAQVALSWTAVSGASRYTVYYSQASIASLTASGVIKVEDISSAAHTVTALSNGRRYYFVVTATNAGGESAASGEVSATPQAGVASISGRLTFDLVPIANSGLDYNASRRAPIRGVWVDAVNASGTVLASTRSDSGGNYSLGVAPNTELRIRVKAHMQQTGAGGPRWDVKVTDNTSRNALYTFEGSLRSSGTGASTRNLHAASGWVPAGSGGRYAEPRVAAPFAILSFTWDAVQKFVAVDPDVNVPALEYRWSIRNRSATARDVADGAIRSSFYQGGAKVNGAAPANSVIYLLGRENENTEEYDQTVVMHEFAHHVAWAMSREDSTGGRHNRNALLDMRVAFSEGFANVLGAIIADDPVYRNSFGVRQARAHVYNNETNPSNNRDHPHRIGWYNSGSVSAILYDIYDGANAADNDALSLGLAPIYNTLTSDGFKSSRYYSSIYLFANQLLNHLPAASRSAAQTGLNALLSRHNIAGRGDNGVGETNRGGLPASARVLPVYKSLSTENSPITLCSVDDNGVFNRLGNRAFVEVSFAQSGAHTLTMTTAAGSRAANPRFRWPPYRGVAQRRSTSQWASAPRSATITGNFRAGEPLVLDAFDEQNTDSVTDNDGDSCFTFSVVKN